MKTIKKFIVVICIMIVILIIALLLISSSNKNNTNNNIVENEVQEENIFTDFESIPYEFEIENKWQKVSSISDYFTISSIYNNYIYMIGEKNYEKLYNILNEKYISEFNVTKDNLINKFKIPLIENSYQNYQGIIAEMISAQADELQTFYIVKGKTRRTEPSEMFEVTIMIGLDEKNKTYTIYPEEYINKKGYNLIKEGKELNIEFNEITPNNYNKYSKVTKKDNEIAEQYFRDWKEIIQYYPEYAYQMLDPEYSAKRFGTYEEFKKYLDLNKQRIALSSINEYKTLSNVNYTDYVCSDKYNNIYRFRKNANEVTFTAFLDNYTIVTEDDSNEYKEGTDEEKAKTCVTQIRDMLNSKDYNAIYNKLNQKFRENNFENIEKFENYINSNLYNLNKLKIVEYSQETEYCTINCTVSNLLDSTEEKEIIFVIKLLEDDTFEISFNIKEIEEE